METGGKIDLYKDTPVRYLGYANEIGESFRALIGPKWVNASYGLATLYVIADTADKTINSYKENKFKEKVLKKVIYTGTDTLVWQMLASVAIPGYTINRFCALTTYLLNRSKRFSPRTTRWIVPGIALSSIPLIIKPIDEFTHLLLDYTLRKATP